MKIFTKIWWKLQAAWKAFKDPAIVADGATLRYALEQTLGNEFLIMKGEWCNDTYQPMFHRVDYRERESIRRLLGWW